MSPQKDNLYVQVLLACALATCDDFGYFAAADVRRPMSLIMKRLYEIPSFSRHLTAFCRPERGAVLQQIGEKYQRRFRFRNPLMQPYVVLKGVADGIVTVDEIMDSAGESAAESDSTEANS